MEVTRIVVLDGEKKHLEKTCRFLKSFGEFSIVGKTTDFSAGVNLIYQKQPDIVIVDIYFNDQLVGKTYVGELSRKYDCKIIVHSLQTDPEVIKECFLVGALDYCIKNDLELLRFSIKKVMMKNNPSAILIEAMRNSYIENIGAKIISPSQFEVYKLLKTGAKRREIAEILNKDENTIKQHINKLRKILEFKHISEVASMEKKIIEGIILREKY